MLLIFASCLLASSASAGGGEINNDGTADLNVNFTYPPTQAEVDQLIAEIQVTSRMLCDASNGALRLGRVKVTAGDGDPASHDIRINFVEPRSNSSLLGLGRDGNGLDTSVVNLYAGGGVNSQTMAHELGHYLFGLGDEYSEDTRWKTSCGIGRGVDGTASEIFGVPAASMGHTIMQSYTGGSCGVRSNTVEGGIDYTGAGGSCNVDSSINLTQIGLTATNPAVRACTGTQVCFPRQSSELTFRSNHDTVHGLADANACPAGVATSKLEVSGTLNSAHVQVPFVSTSFAAADASAAFRYDFDIVDSQIRKHKGTLYFVRRTGTNKWTVHVGVPRSEVSSCPLAGTGDLCILDSIDFTNAPAVPGCGDFGVGTGEQCDIGRPVPAGSIANLCGNVYPFTFGNLGCNNACGYDASQCFIPLFTCGIFPGVQAPEQCDGTSLGGATCQSLGFGAGGSLSCNANCSYNTSACNPAAVYVPPAVTIDGGRSLPININFAYAGAATTISLTKLDAGVGTSFSISTPPLTWTYGTDAGSGKTTCANDISRQFCVDGFLSSSMRFETSHHSHTYRKDCSGHWITEVPCNTTADCGAQHPGATCETTTGQCEDPPGSGTMVASCKRCREPSPLTTPVGCTECSTNSRAMCGVPEHEVLFRVLKDLNLAGRTLTFANPPTSADSIATNLGWDEPPAQCLNQVNIDNKINVADQVYIIIDMSGSMLEPAYAWSLESKLNYAKAAVRDYVNLRASGTIPIGLSYFDHEVNPTLASAPNMKQVPIALPTSGTPTTVAAQILASNQAMVTRNGATGIGNALLAAVDAFNAAGAASQRRIYILTDGKNNTGPAADAQVVRDALDSLDIHVDIAPIGDSVDQEKLDKLAALSNGSVRYLPQGDYVPDAFADFGLQDKGESLVLPQTESLVYNQAAFDAAGCTRDTCIAPVIHAPLATSESHSIVVEPGAAKLDVLLVSRQYFSGFWSPDFQLVSPNGSQVITPADTAFVRHDDGRSTCVEVTSCRYWSRITVPNPAAGTWRLELATTQAFQAQFVSARVQHSQVQCFVDMEKHVVDDGKPGVILVSAQSSGGLVDARTYNVTGTVTGPNGVAVPLTFKVDRWNPDHARAAFTGFVGRGTYDVKVLCNVPATAQLAPPEPSVPAGASVPVPPFIRFATDRMFYKSATMPPPITPGDCDFDTIPDAIEGTGDVDADGFADRCDSDADNDGLSDFTEGNVQTDGDGVPDYKDTDSDADTIPDERDNCRKLGNLNQSDIDGDGFGDVCDLDMDGDGPFNSIDNCPTVPNTNQADSNGNGIGDACEGLSGCTPVITANAQSIARCFGDVGPAAVTASATCGGVSNPLFGRVTSVNGVALTGSSTFAAGSRPDLPLGTVVIRWSATGPGGITVTRNQTVTITEADTSAACCPTGSTVVTGTSSSQVLTYPAVVNYCVMAKGGNDVVTGGLGPDVFSGGTGNDDLFGISGYDTLIGGTGDDDLTLAFAGNAYGGAGNDTLIGIFGPALMVGGAGDDAIFGSPFNDDITPGDGSDFVLAGMGNDTVRINASCEAAWFETLDGGLGFDVLYTPVPLTTLELYGLIVVGFESIIVTGTTNQYKSACGITTCTPTPCSPLPWCGSQLWSSCPGQLLNCPCNTGNTCRDAFTFPAAPGVLGTCAP